jgi:hypothetical protein
LEKLERKPKKCYTALCKHHCAPYAINITDSWIYKPATNRWLDTRQQLACCIAIGAVTNTQGWGYKSQEVRSKRLTASSAILAQFLVKSAAHVQDNTQLSALTLNPATLRSRHLCDTAQGLHSSVRDQLCAGSKHIQCIPILPAPDRGPGVLLVM